MSLPQFFAAWFLVAVIVSLVFGRFVEVGKGRDETYEFWKHQSDDTQVVFKLEWR